MGYRNLIQNMKPYIPVYKRPPNTFLRYEERQFDDGASHTGTERVAIFLDKNKKLSEMTAQIIWNKQHKEIQHEQILPED